MKNVIRFIGISIVLLTLSVNVIAQIVTVSTTATATANIIAPLTINKVDDMNFGNVAVQNATIGAVILATDDSRTSTGGASPVYTAPGVVKAAAFDLTGSDGYVTLIDLPASCTVTSGANTMLVDNFVSNPPTPSFIFPTGSTATLLVGARLNTDAGQPVGLYVSATAFTVTVSYQ
jgi:hypothetical protein